MKIDVLKLSSQARTQFNCILANHLTTAVAELFRTSFGETKKTRTNNFIAISSLNAVCQRAIHYQSKVFQIHRSGAVRIKFLLKTGRINDQE